MTTLLLVKNLKVSVQDKIVLKNINLEIKEGEIHAIMGPNGSGKSTLAMTLMGHPRYKIEGGEIIFCGQPINKLNPNDRAKLGLFLSMQNPVEIEGITLKNFLRQMVSTLKKDPASKTQSIPLKEFNTLLKEKLDLLGVAPEFVERDLNLGLSGGEKKMSEVIQLAMAQPKFAILDELDSGLDVDALKTVCACLNEIKQTNPKMACLVITHYNRILDYLKPNFVHMLQNGEIVRSGGAELAAELEVSGYKTI
jgi:Fe-S cluster assembly ATP-binding protein